jgi:L-alanine-DL-glutamate epimerase-like enolase superfamily enzyme
VTDATVAGVDTGLYGVPTDASLEDATQSFDELELVVARIETSAGVEGVGFTYTIGEGGTAIRRFLDDVLVPTIAGESAAPQAARNRLRAETTFVGREGVSELALSAVRASPSRPTRPTAGGSSSTRRRSRRTRPQPPPRDSPG